MTTLSKALLTVAIAGLAGGSVVDYYYDPTVNPSLTVVLPLGAIALGLFLIVFALQKEVVLFGIEEKKKLQSLPDKTVVAEPALRNVSNELILNLEGKNL